MGPKRQDILRGHGHFKALEAQCIDSWCSSLFSKTYFPLSWFRYSAPEDAKCGQSGGFYCLAENDSSMNCGEREEGS